MRRLIWLAFALVACTSDEEKARQREAAMIEQAQADAAAEAEFADDSLKLAASVTIDTIRRLERRDRYSTNDEDDEETSGPRFEAIAANGQVCLLTPARFTTVVVGDTLSCQWGPRE